MQISLDLGVQSKPQVKPLKSQLLKWIGNKQRFAHEIITFFPENFNRYFEPFLGSGAVLASLAPREGFGSDIYRPLMEIWQALKSEPNTLLNWYTERHNLIEKMGKQDAYNYIKGKFNENPNGADFVFLTRACYGGVIRFRQNDGYMSTPCGVHDPISPQSFERRIIEWHKRVKSTNFFCTDFREAIHMAEPGDLIYCDPPYSFSQTIVYGAQSFDLSSLLSEIEWCKRNDIYVALSIDGTKKSGELICDIPIPKNLFKREVSVNIGRSMLRRFQMQGETLENEHVTDRLLLTY